MDEEKRLQRIKGGITTYPGFPKEGIVFRFALTTATTHQIATNRLPAIPSHFRDVFPLFYEPTLFEDVLQLFQSHIQSLTPPASAIVGLESRGFLIGPTLALRLGIPFIPVRKAGKLPGKVQSCAYELEYGSDIFEIQEKSLTAGLNCVLVDDLLATGGSLKTAIKLIQKCGGNVISSAVIIELNDLGGRQHISSPVYSLVQY